MPAENVTAAKLPCVAMGWGIARVPQIDESTGPRRPARLGLGLLLGLAVALCVSSLGFGQAAAQSSSSPPSSAVPQSRDDLQKQYDDTFQQMLRNPTDIELTFRFAALSAQLANYESAITALERLLLFNPNLPRIKVELAGLYIRLGSFDVAQVYLNQAKQAPNMPPELLGRIDRLQSQIDRLHSRNRWTATALLGLRYQSDADAGPAGSSVIAGGLPATLSSDFVRKPDWNVFLAGTAQHSYDLGLQENATIETNAQLYLSKQFQVSRVDLGFLEVNSGPRFDVSSGDDTYFTARPYLLANDVALGDNQYFWTVGGGLELDRAITSKLQGTIDYEYRLKRFSNSGDFPLATLLSSELNSLAGLLTYHVLENGYFSIGSSIDDEDAKAQFNSNQVAEFYATYTHSFQLPFTFPPGPLVITPAIYRIYTVYGGPDSAVSLTKTELTQEWRYMLTVQLGLTRNMAANVQFMRQVVASDLINFKYNNTAAIVGLLWTF
jgi:hypothetical protein